MKSACVAFATGCDRSQIDAANIVEYLKANNWSITHSLKDADIVFLGTFGVNAFAEQKSIEFLSIAEKKCNKCAKIIPFGCLLGINKERILERFAVETISPQTMHHLDEILKYQFLLPESIYVPGVRHQASGVGFPRRMRNFTS